MDSVKAKGAGEVFKEEPLENLVDFGAENIKINHILSNEELRPSNARPN